MAQVSWPACEAGVVQMRWAKRTEYMGFGEPEARYDDVLWRTALCQPGRWHWQDNKCKCGPFPFSLQWAQIGNKLEHPQPIYGTWNRDWPGIASKVRFERQRIAERRAHEAAVKAAKGPRQRAITLTDVRTACFDFETRYNALLNESIDRMIRDGVWGGKRNWSHL